MNNSKAKRIQALLINHLQNCGAIDLLLPDGVKLEIDIRKKGKHGFEVSDDYCSVRASRDGNATLLDTYNIGLEYADEGNLLLESNDDYDTNGRPMKRVEVV